MCTFLDFEAYKSVPFKRNIKIRPKRENLLLFMSCYI
uniref:Uncharacterized protein n=1 Tax=Rhizophora mucronata TaxID=61149 RepID=A0A2P2JBK5_RHIMU